MTVSNVLNIPSEIVYSYVSAYVSVSFSHFPLPNAIDHPASQFINLTYFRACSTSEHIGLPDPFHDS